MTDGEIIKGNALIEKFMGINDDLKYHSSWDWLMLVVKKCWEKVSEFQYDDEEYIYITEEIFHPDYMLAEFMNADVHSIWNRVVEFIKWYDQQNK